MTIDRVYAKLIYKILREGDNISTRNSDVKRIFAEKIEINRTPLISLRKTAWRNSLREFEWILSGSNKIEDLNPKVRHWWNPWVVEGEVPFNYSRQFRHWNAKGDEEGFDQLRYLEEGIKEHPFSRRNVITTWNTEEMASSLCPITNCHSTILQAFVSEQNELSLVMYQRSSDVIVGLGANLLQYWAFLLYLAHKCDKKVGFFTWIGGDCHIYEEHFELAKKILEVSDQMTFTPTLIYTPTSEDFKAMDFDLEGEYSPILQDKAEMVV